MELKFCKSSAKFQRITLHPIHLPDYMISDQVDELDVKFLQRISVNCEIIFSIIKITDANNNNTNWMQHLSSQLPPEEIYKSVKIQKTTRTIVQSGAVTQRGAKLSRFMSKQQPNVGKQLASINRSSFSNEQAKENQFFELPGNLSLHIPQVTLTEVVLAQPVWSLVYGAVGSLIELYQGMVSEHCHGTFEQGTEPTNAQIGPSFTRQLMQGCRKLVPGAICVWVCVITNKSPFRKKKKQSKNKGTRSSGTHA